MTAGAASIPERSENKDLPNQGFVGRDEGPVVTEPETQAMHSRR